MKRAIKNECKINNYIKCLIFFIIIAITIIHTKISFSKYGSSKKAISDIKVAAFAVDAVSSSGQGNLLDLDCNGDIGYTVNYKFDVKNQKNNKISDVDTKYGVEIVLPQELPTGITMKLDNKVISTTSNKLTYLVSEVGVLKKGDLNINTHTLTFVADPEVVRYDKTFSGIKINVIAEQIN